jgi:hypothetical protein
MSAVAVVTLGGDGDEKSRRAMVEDVLVNWGIWATGGRLKSVGIRPPDEGQQGYDEVAADARLVVSLGEEFERAEPVLMHVYGHRAELSEFRYRGPGETLRHALIRLGWFGHLGTPEGEIPAKVAETFRELLDAKLAHWERNRFADKKANKAKAPEEQPGEGDSLRTRYRY